MITGFFYRTLLPHNVTLQSITYIIDAYLTIEDGEKAADETSTKVISCFSLFLDKSVKVPCAFEKQGEMDREHLLQPYDRVLMPTEQARRRIHICSRHKENLRHSQGGYAFGKCVPSYILG